ncbi:polysaccharide pyruvyl transferase family protein [Sphingobacterium tabacisoli]|uniref:Polysaccharide pyruvyl transferase family protein n=1 Tax=Sphingobacterium tabacisoli TaxID=2044855 RepID=A0ABW5LB68_9SPHI|nr:polysaccharide pyruvyl transferase family protein [Sphingobacterium tabacisoli]
MKKINLLYWEGDNYGDVLSQALIEELSGAKVRLCGKPFNLLKALKSVAKDVLTLSTKRTRRILLPWQESMLGIGSVLSWGGGGENVWGSGFMNEFEEFNGGQIFAVRGPRTAAKLKASGFQSTETFGDPALLLPLWLEPAYRKAYDVSIIPHWTEADDFKQRFGNVYNIIDPRSRDIVGVTKQITASKYILSTSLHGIIVAHAYGIPALWIKKGYIHTDGFKFDDYFSSVGISFYDGFENLEEILASTENWKKLFEENMHQALINCTLEDIQLGLLKAAPFVLKEKYEVIMLKLQENESYEAV